MITQQLINKALYAAISAGKEILEVYKTKNFKVEYKEDLSPVTLADKKASKAIIKALQDFDYPILSEEEYIVPYKERKKWNTLWIVDPLDGTKEFMNRNDEFTVNIALVSYGEPIFGVIYLPVSGELFYGGKNIGSFKLLANEFKGNIMIPGNEGERLPIDNRLGGQYIVVGSRSHDSPQTDEFIMKLKQEHTNIQFKKYGSALKFCRLAEGKVDLYPRFQHCMEWDTAAGHAILQGVEKDILSVEKNLPLTYNKENLLSPFFIAK